MYTISAFLVLVAVASTTVNGLQCYVCSGPGCADPYTGNFNHQVTCTPSLADEALNGMKNLANRVSTTLQGWGVNAKVDQPNAKMVCAKLDTKLTEGDGELVTRICGSTSDKYDFCDEVTKLNDKIKCSWCDGDLCNGSSAVHYSLGALLVSVAVLMANLR